MTPTVERSIDIAAPPARVFAILTDPASMKVWLSEGGTTVRTDWTIGGDILLATEYNGRVHEDRGTVLAFEPPTLVRYSHFTRISRLPDTPENRSIIELRLAPGDGGTTLTVTHSQLVALAAVEHARFYWGVTLNVIRKLAEGEPIRAP